MSKRKSDFQPLQYINPFDDKYHKRMVCEEWSDINVLNQWRKDNTKWLKDPKHIDLLDIDELLSQWNICPAERKVNPNTCNMIFKELAIVLRLVDAEHQDAIVRDCLPGVVKSSTSSKWMYIKYDLNAKDPKKGTKVELFDTENEAYEAYKNNRNSLIEAESAKALEYHLISDECFDTYFSYLDIICVRDADYYRKKLYSTKGEN